jgi:hypothetical protein
MRRICFGSILVVLAFFSPLTQASPPTYFVSEIVPPAGATPSTFAADVNENGVIVGSQSFPDSVFPDGVARAFRLRGDTFRILGSQAPGTQSGATGVNALVHVVGHRNFEPIVWVGNNTIELPHPRDSAGIAFRISDNDWIAGDIALANSPPIGGILPVVWIPKSIEGTWRVKDLTKAIYEGAGLGAEPELDLAHFRNSDVNNAGTVVGMFSYILKGKNSFHTIGYFWRASTGKARRIGGSRQAYRVNNVGQILIELKDEFFSTTQTRKWALWKDGGLTYVASDEAYSSLFVEDLNDLGQAVGSVGLGPGPNHAALFQDGVTYDLSELVDPSDPLKGIAFEFAVGLNNKGQILAHTVDEVTHYRRSYLLTPND